MPTVSRVSPEEVWGVHTDRRFTREKTIDIVFQVCVCVIRLVGGGRLAIRFSRREESDSSVLRWVGLNERGMAAVGAGVEGDQSICCLCWSGS